MADYPFTEVALESQFVPDSATLVDYAEDGTLHTRRLSAATQYSATLIHPYYSRAQRDELLAHFSGQAGAAFRFAAPWGDVYLMRYVAPPQFQPRPGDRWDLTVKMAGAKL